MLNSSSTYVWGPQLGVDSCVNVINTTDATTGGTGTAMCTLFPSQICQVVAHRARDPPEQRFGKFIFPKTLLYVMLSQVQVWERV